MHVASSKVLLYSKLIFVSCLPQRISIFSSDNSYFRKFANISLKVSASLSNQSTLPLNNLQLNYCFELPIKLSGFTSLPKHVQCPVLNRRNLIQISSQNYIYTTEGFIVRVFVRFVALSQPFVDTGQQLFPNHRVLVYDEVLYTQHLFLKIMESASFQIC